MVLSKSKTYSAFVFLLFSYACNTKADVKKSSDSIVVVQAKPQIEKYRTKVNTAPVAFYSEALKGDGLQGVFAVKIYETKKTFHYLMKVQYAELSTVDTLKLPDFGAQPDPEIKPGSEAVSCIVGFLGEKKEFMEYKLIQVKNNRIKIKALKHYAVAAYRNEL